MIIADRGADARSNINSMGEVRKGRGRETSILDLTGWFEVMIRSTELSMFAIIGAKGEDSHAAMEATELPPCSPLISV